jgi:hypothetical protein
MTPSILAEWLRRQGHRVVETPSGFWYDQAPRVYQAVPYHWCIEPTERELTMLLRDERAVALRYSTPLAVHGGKVSYHAVFDGDAYDLSRLSANARSNVRRGLKACTVERVSLARLADEGWRLQADTLDRQGRPGGLSRTRWERICAAADGLAGFEAWAAIVDGRLASSILTGRVDDTCYMFYPQNDRRYLPQHVANALAYTLTTELLSRPGVRQVFYGLHSLDAPPSVDEFKFRMGYRAKPVRQRVVFHPWAAFMVNPATHAIVTRLLRRWRRPVLAKAEGMIRFCLEGQRPLDQQDWPACLGRPADAAA